jgi:hypothetical protein
MATKAQSRPKSKKSTGSQAKAHDRRLLERAGVEDSEGSSPASSTLRGIRAAEPVEPPAREVASSTVAVPMTAVVQLFDMGNWSSGSGETLRVNAIQLAQNAIRHAALDLRVIGTAASNEDPYLEPSEICDHCHRVSLQLLATLEIIDALDSRATHEVQS